ncbi:zinc transporter ZIP9-B-like [Limulus polyphemus]|uniref:Zinc transporter ZIP9-B-like n=1 Tax=Limulus polyphemus TaxID=6850 RepID=A0ABM1BGD7_LIMPO|nr:zinc transporter ZIP9-B-like [Limulus polyphemus]
MNPIVILFLSAITMFTGCCVAGVIPLVVTLSGRKLQLVSVLGAGLLVGTALSVIIPEGVNTLYSSHLEIQSHIEREHEITTNQTEFPNVQEMEHTDHHHHHSLIGEAHILIGVTLILGFIFMLLIDQISSAHSRLSNTDTKEGEAKQEGYNITTTIGLVVHSAVDGIALGAALNTSHTDIEMIVFIAIMLHKAPAAFGLVTFLLHEGLDKKLIRRHLLLFALAAPVLTIISYFSINQTAKTAMSTYSVTGIAMLFSAGTFLYVATVHVLPEVIKHSHTQSANTESVQSKQKGLKVMELLALIVGAILPMLLSFGHYH